MLIPATVQILHAFDHDGNDKHQHFEQNLYKDFDYNHDKETTYFLNKEDHVQFEEECTVCELIFDTSGLLQIAFDRIELKLENPEHLYSYNFQKNHQSLSYSLRGPPSF